MVKKENIWNIPNPVTFLRVVCTFILIYLFMFRFSVKYIVIFFAIGAITDFLDGQLARRLSMVTKFGAKFDIIADRFLWITTGLGVLIFFPINGIFTGTDLVLMLLILTREILCLPSVLINFALRRKVLVPARWSGKVTTFLQGFAIPILIFSVYLPKIHWLAVSLAIACALSGIWAAINYAKDLFFARRKK